MSFVIVNISILFCRFQYLHIFVGEQINFYLLSLSISPYIPPKSRIFMFFGEIFWGLSFIVWRVMVCRLEIILYFHHYNILITKKSHHLSKSYHFSIEDRILLNTNQIISLSISYRLNSENQILAQLKFISSWIKYHII